MPKCGTCHYYDKIFCKNRLSNFYMQFMKKSLWCTCWKIKKAIAIDFDGCLCTSEYPEIGNPILQTFRAAKEEQLNGAGLILWTCREGKLLEEAVDFCRINGLKFDSINESLPEWIEEYGTRPKKVGATEYWDDKAVRKGYIEK